MTGGRAAIYARISEDRYGEAEGVERQVTDCEKLAQQRGLDVVATFIDNNRSAMKGKRPEYKRMTEAAQAGEFDVLIVYRPDRLYRKLSELAHLTEMLSGVPVYSVRSGDIDLSNAEGKLRANIMGAVAQHESDVKGERISDAHRQRAAKGRFTGGQRRFGYRHSTTRIVLLHGAVEGTEVAQPTGPLELVPEEAAALKSAYGQVLAGATLAAIAREWNALGLRTPTSGKPFIAQVVRTNLLRPMNAGLACYKGQILEVAHEAPPIIDVESWKGVRAILTDPSRVTNAGGPVAYALLVSVLRCKVCLELDDESEARMRTKKRTFDRGTDRAQPDHSYSCKSNNHVVRSRKRLDEAVEAIVLPYILGNRATLQRPIVTTQQAAKRETELGELREKLAKWQARAADLDIDDYLAATQPLKAQISKLEKASVRISATPATATLLASDDPIATWMSMSVAAKRIVINEVILKIEVGRVAVRGARDQVLHNVSLYERNGRMILPTVGAGTWSELMARNMVPMTAESAKRVSAVMFGAAI